MRRHVVRGAMVAAVLCGCGRFGFAPVADDAKRDGGAVEAANACGDWYMPAHFRACNDLPIPASGLNLTIPGTYVYDTSTTTLVDPNGQPVPHENAVIVPNPSTGEQAVVVSAQSFLLGSGVKLRVVGALPLIIASWSTIQVSGTIDVSSNMIDGRGAGSNPMTCGSRQGSNGANKANGADGAGGGGHQGGGGAGGLGTTCTSPSGGGGAAGTAMTLAAADLLGGCRGGTGGTGAGAGGSGGHGGGAIQLTAFDSITIAASGVVHAGGSGGSGAIGTDGGGGGGGAGGMIGLEGKSVTVQGGLFANGGGGGEGATVGGHGQDGQPSTTAAIGGLGGTGNGGNGGNGGATSVGGGDGECESSDGAGGGGGGAGHILVRAPTKNVPGPTSPVPTYP